MPAMNTDSAVRPCRLPVVWNDSSGVSEKQFRLRQSFQLGAPDDARQAVRPEVFLHVVERAAHVLEERRARVGIVVERHGLFEDRPIPGLAHVGGHARDEPERVVVEAAADVVVAALRERLVLVVGAAVGLLRGGDVEDALARALGHEVHEPQQVLVRVAEAHAAPDARLEVRGAARHVEGHHALVRVPDVDHAVQAIVGRRDAVVAEHAGPPVGERLERGVHLLGARELLDERARPRLVQDARAVLLPLVVAWVLDVAEREDERLLLTGRERHGEAVRRDGRPAARDGVARRARRHDARPREVTVLAQGTSRGRCRRSPRPSR